MRNVAYQHADRKGHLGSAPALFGFAVNARDDFKVNGADVRLYERAYGTEGVEGFTARELHVFALKVARSHVVQAGVAQNVMQRVIIGTKLSRLASYNDSQFTFM